MSANTSIEWCDHTWNPWRGCTKVSPGCLNCYAERQSKRNPAVLGKWGKGAPRVLAKNWGDPVRWDKYRFKCPNCGHWNHSSHDICHSEKNDCHTKADYFILSRPKVFPSLCDWLDDEVPIEWLAQFLHFIHKTPNIDWLLLTKRPHLWRQRIETSYSSAIFDSHDLMVHEWLDGRPPANVWVGTSVEDQQRADERIPELLKIPAKLRFLSVEPLLGPVDLSANRGTHDGSGLCWDWAGEPIHVPHCDYKAIGKEPPKGPRIDWVIVGGESGPKSRPCNVDWIRSIVQQCEEAKVPCFVKQLGADVVDERANSADFVPGKECWPEGAAVNGCTVILKHPKGGDPAEWPDDLEVRQFPEVTP